MFKANWFRFYLPLVIIVMSIMHLFAIFYEETRELSLEEARAKLPEVIHRSINRAHKALTAYAKREGVEVEEFDGPYVETSVYAGPSCYVAYKSKNYFYIYDFWLSKDTFYPMPVGDRCLAEDSRCKWLQNAHKIYQDPLSGEKI